LGGPGVAPPLNLEVAFMEKQRLLLYHHEFLRPDAIALLLSATTRVRTTCFLPVPGLSLSAHPVIEFFTFLFLKFLFFFFICLRFCLFLRENFIFKFVLMLFFFIVLNSDFYSVFITSTSFGWLLLISSGDINMLVLFCISLTYETALCDPMKELYHLLTHFLLFVNISVLFWFILDLLLASSSFFLFSFL
jgi:hypothetical protein